MNLKERYRLLKELNNILNDLLNDVNTYYTKDLLLNSEGMKLLSKAIKIINTLYPQLRNVLKNVRIDPTYDSIVKLASKIREFAELQD
jgi:hypothetical protein